MTIVNRRAARAPGDAGSTGGGFWRTVPGVLTAVAGLVTAITGLVVALSQSGVFERAAPPADISGLWRAHVTYPWGLTVAERFLFQVDRGRLSGTATYLANPRGIEAATVDGERISFVVEAEEIVGSERRRYQVRYDGVLVDGGLHFTLRDSRGNPPVQFAAVRELN